MKNIIIAMYLTLAFTAAGQVLSFKENSFDIGDISDLKPVSKEVHFENTGDKDLVIDRVKTSCGCTTSTLEKKILKPTETGKLTVTFNPSGRKGKQNKRVTFFSNDVNKKDQAISFSANVIPLWDITPRRIKFTFADDKVSYSNPEQNFVIRNLGNQPIIIEEIKNNNDNFIVESIKEKEISPGAKKEVMLQVKANFFPEKYTSSVILVKAKIGDELVSRSIRAVIKPPTTTVKK